MLAIMRYGAGQPMYRMDKWQTHFGVPLPASTQWELIEAASTTPALVYDALIGLGAQAHQFSRLLALVFVERVKAAIRRRVGQRGSRGRLGKFWKSELHLVSTFKQFIRRLLGIVLCRELSQQGFQLFSIKSFLELSNLSIRELVALLVTYVTGVTFQPVPFHLVLGSMRIKRTPKVLIFHRFL
jgi:hypothetical protein